MTKWGVQPIESYSLVQYAVQLPCFVCNGDNRHDSEFCRDCGAPLALALQQQKRQEPKLVAVIGAANSGKTSYLGMLTDILSRQHGALRILARGAFSVSLQQHAMAALAEHRYPDHTTSDPKGWNWVHCEVHGILRRRHIELVMPDVAGDALMQEIEHPNSKPVIREFLRKCAGAIVLVDAERLEKGDRQPDFDTMKILSYLGELSSHRKNGWQRRPIATVFTKADCSEACFEDPAEYAGRVAPGLHDQCEQRMNRYRYFAASVVGASAEVEYYGSPFHLPLRVEPRGVTEPFGWLVKQL